MMLFSPPIRRFIHNTAGSVVIESAFVIPILATLCLGGLEVSQIVARNTELKSALAEAAAVALAHPPENQDDVDTIEQVVEVSTGLAAADVTMARKYRCNEDAELVDEETDCVEGDVVASYLEITLTDTYEPIWTGFGIGSDVDLTTTRRVQIS